MEGPRFWVSSKLSGGATDSTWRTMGQSSVSECCPHTPNLLGALSTLNHLPRPRPAVSEPQGLTQVPGSCRPKREP